MSTVSQQRITPTISTSAYDAGDQLGGLQTLSRGASDASDLAVKLSSMLVIDKDAEGAALRVFFFSQAPTLSSSDNAALNISDADFASYCLGFIDVAAGDYVANAGVKVASIEGINLDLVSTEVVAGKKTGKLYAIAVAVGTPTYTATSDLVFVYSLEN